MVGRCSFWQPLFAIALGSQVIHLCRGGPRYGSAGVRHLPGCGPETNSWQVQPWRRSATGLGLGWQFEGLRHLASYSSRPVELRTHSPGNRSSHGFSWWQHESQALIKYLVAVVMTGWPRPNSVMANGTVSCSLLQLPVYSDSIALRANFVEIELQEQVLSTMKMISSSYSLIYC